MPDDTDDEYCPGCYSAPAADGYHLSPCPIHSNQNSDSQKPVVPTSEPLGWQGCGGYLLLLALLAGFLLLVKGAIEVVEYLVRLLGLV